MLQNRKIQVKKQIQADSLHCVAFFLLAIRLLVEGRSLDFGPAPHPAGFGWLYGNYNVKS